MKSKLGAPLAVAAAIMLAPAARAGTITENFTITINPAATLSFTSNNDFAGTSVAQFNPANGTLTSFSASITGSASWTSTSGTPSLGVIGGVSSAGLSIGFGSLTPFSTPGTITLSLLLSPVTDPAGLAKFTGIDTVTTDLLVTPLSAQPSTDTFGTNGSLSGTLTYNFADVPGPIAGAGLPGLILACGVLLALARRRRQIA